MKNNIYSNINGQAKSDSTIVNILDSLPKVLDGFKGNIASEDGYTITEHEQGIDKQKKGYEVKILGMKPLVFILVSLGVVIASGIAISRLGNKNIK